MEPTQIHIEHTPAARDAADTRTTHAWENAVTAVGGAPRTVEADVVHLHIATTDARLASLYTGTIDARGRLHLTRLDALHTPWEHFHEQRRPDALGRGPSASAVQRPASGGHEPEEMARRFARMVADWLHEAQRKSPNEPFAAFATPRFLGLLRDALGPMGDGIALYRGEFTGLRVNELAAHPTVRLLAQMIRAETRVAATRAEVLR